MLDGSENIIIHTYKSGSRITSVIENKVWPATSIRYFVFMSVVIVPPPSLGHI